MRRITACVCVLICIEMTKFKSNYADKNKQFNSWASITVQFHVNSQTTAPNLYNTLGFCHLVEETEITFPPRYLFFNRLQVLKKKKKILMLICQNSLRGSQIIANEKVVFF